MNILRKVIRYICSHYPHTRELSKARLTKMVYLADWEYAKKHGCQLTDIKWYFNNFGPYVDDVFYTAFEDSEITIETTNTQYGTPKTTIVYKGDSQETQGLSEDQKEVLKFVIDETKPLYWNAFIKYVYNTYPVKNNPRYTELDLVAEAEAEKRKIEEENIVF